MCVAVLHNLQNELKIVEVIKETLKLFSDSLYSSAATALSFFGSTSSKHFNSSHPGVNKRVTHCLPSSISEVHHCLTVHTLYVSFIVINVLPHYH